MSKNKFYFLLTLIFAMITGGQAFAQDKTQNIEKPVDFREVSKKIPIALLENGYSNIGDLKLQSLLDQLDLVEWKTSNLFFTNPEGNRTGAVNNSNDNTALINLPILKYTSQETLSVLTLHEGLGARSKSLGNPGYSDDNYQRSIALYFMAQPLEDEMPEGIVKQVLIPLFAANRQGGGSSGVGSGGDPIGIEVKIITLKMLNDEVDRYHLAGEFKTVDAAALFKRILLAPFEIQKQNDLFANSPLVIDKIGDRDGERGRQHKDTVLSVKIPYFAWVAAKLSGKSNSEEYAKSILRRFAEELE